MSGETEKDVSGWTTDTLRMHFQRELDQIQLRMDERFEAYKVVVREYQDSQLDVLRQRFDAIDRATELLNSQVTQFPTDVDVAVGRLKELHLEKFDSVKEQFAQRDVAVAAALNAQKESAAKQEETFKESIGKSEGSTTKTIDSLERKVDDLKDRMALLEQAQIGASQNRVGGQAAIASVIALVVVVVAVAGLIVTLITTSGNP